MGGPESGRAAAHVDDGLDGATRYGAAAAFLSKIGEGGLPGDSNVNRVALRLAAAGPWLGWVMYFTDCLRREAYRVLDDRGVLVYVWRRPRFIRGRRDDGTRSSSWGG